ncbi:MAG: hypothetical protein SPF18_12710 [Blautia sp.]|nr:hypothetical protein [Blautia sp.]
MAYCQECGEKLVEKYLKSLVKKDRGFPPDLFNICMERAGLKYRMRKISKGSFVIEDTSNENID